MDETFDAFTTENLGSGQEQFDSFYDFTDQALDLLLKTLILNTSNGKLFF